MKKRLKLKRLFLGVALALPIIYVGFGWWVGLSYGRKAAVFGPYSDIPVTVSTDMLNSSLEELVGTCAVVFLRGAKDAQGPVAGKDGVHFNVKGYFELPGTWRFHLPPSYGRKAKYTRQKTFLLTGSYSRAIGRELKNPGRGLGYYSLDELSSFLKSTGRIEDLRRLRPYILLAGLEDRFPHLYSETVLVSKAMGNVFSDNLLPYDVLGLSGICVLFIALARRSIWIWLYYLYWIFSYWFGRIGYHDPALVFTKAGWQVILWSFWNGLIVKEGRLFLVIALSISLVTFGMLGLTHIVKRTFYAKLRTGKRLNGLAL